MIGYVTLGTNQLPQAVAFYDRLFEPLGIGRFMESEGHYVAWARNAHEPSLAVTRPFDGNAATIGNGVMVALAVSNPHEVKTLHAKALALGATDEGAPGPRGAGFYAAYFRDLDGNKLNVFCMEAQAT
jgi:catechol 2,3-dioxygenase-like lactoylglutathione lyase family enzyme